MNKSEKQADKWEKMSEPKQKKMDELEIELTSVEKWVMKYMNYSLEDIKLNRKLLQEDIQLLLSKPKQR